MNTYRLVLGCVVIVCYLQQHGWAAPSQTENAQPSIQQTQVDNPFGEEILEDAINQALLNLSEDGISQQALLNLPKEAIKQALLTQSHIQKRSTLSSLFERIRQNMRDSLFPQFYCNAKVLRTDMRVNYFEVSNTMRMNILVAIICILFRL